MWRGRAKPQSREGLADFWCVWNHNGAHLLSAYLEPATHLSIPHVLTHFILRPIL